MAFRASGDTSVLGNVLPMPEGTLASVTVERHGSGFPRLTTNFFTQLSIFSPLPHLILLHSLLCGIFQPNTSFPLTSPSLPTLYTSFSPQYQTSSHLFLLYPSILSWYHRQVFAEATKNPLGNPIFNDFCHICPNHLNLLAAIKSFMDSPILKCLLSAHY